MMRSLIRSTGFDIHRHNPNPTQWDWLRSFSFSTIIDVGANTGQFIDEVCDFDARFIAIEPLKSALPSLYKKVDEFRKRHALLSVYPYAIGDHEGVVEITANAYSPSSSLLPLANKHRDAFPHATEAETYTVKMRPLDFLDIAGPVLLNIDVQGYEDKVLSGASKLLSQTAVVLIEASFVPLYEGQPLFSDILSIMHNHGFRYRGALRTKTHKLTGEPLFEDAIFERL
jgi:FkbM family methyltransferase